MFKIVWNGNVVIPVLERIRSSYYTITLVILFNSVLLPILVPIFVDIDCFQTYFNPPSAVTTSFDIDTYMCFEVVTADLCSGSILSVETVL